MNLAGACLYPGSCPGMPWSAATYVQELTGEMDIFILHSPHNIQPSLHIDWNCISLPLVAEIRLLGSVESPLNLQLNYGTHKSYMEVRLVQMKAARVDPMSRVYDRYDGSDTEETLSDEGNPNVAVPKDEGGSLVYDIIITSLVKIIECVMSQMLMHYIICIRRWSLS